MVRVTPQPRRNNPQQIRPRGPNRIPPGVIIKSPQRTAASPQNAQYKAWSNPHLVTHQQPTGSRRIGMANSSIASRGPVTAAASAAQNPSRMFKFTAGMRNPPGQSQRNQEPITASMLAAAPPQEQKQMLGERLFPLIQSMYPDLAGKVTGMLLECDNSELLYLLESRETLEARVDEAVAVLKIHFNL